MAVAEYIGGKAVDYAKKYWNKVADDGRVMTSAGVNPSCGGKGFPDGTEFLQEAAVSEAYGDITQGDTVVVANPGNDFKQNTESFTVSKKLKFFKFNHRNPDDTYSEHYVSGLLVLKQDIVRSIDYLTIGEDVLQATIWPTIGDYVRDDMVTPKSVCTVRLLCDKTDDAFTTLGSSTKIGEGTKIDVTYTYAAKGRKISYRPMDDCCHFVSCCLLAGDLKVWANDDKRIGGVSRPCAKGQHDVNGLYRMFKWMEKKENGALVEFVEDKRAWRDDDESEEDAEERWKETFKDNMKPGDVVLYYREQPKKFVHSALYVDYMKTATDSVDYPRITCHTFARFPTDDCTWDDCRWHINRKKDWRYSLIHIKPYSPEEI